MGEDDSGDSAAAGGAFLGQGGNLWKARGQDSLFRHEGLQFNARVRGEKGSQSHALDRYRRNAESSRHIGLEDFDGGLAGDAVDVGAGFGVVFC